MTVTAIGTERWAEAQAGELEFWQSADRTELCKYLDALYVEVLEITPDVVRGLSVLDLGGGPMPLADLLQFPIGALTVVDPLPFPPSPAYARVTMAAEDYDGAQADEVWGYNVLQHVRDPAAVIATAKRHAAKRVRWFDWTDSPIVSHHPHSITATWLVEQFDGWQLSVTKKGSVRVPKVQHYVAVVAERT